MVIPAFPQGTTGREGIRWKTGAVPATVIAFCVQRTNTSLGENDPWEDALPGKSQETCHSA